MDFKEFKSPAELRAWASSVYSKDLLKKFDLNIVSNNSPLAHYTNSSSKLINDALRRGILKGTQYKYENLQADLLQCIVPESIVVYRFVDRKELFLWWLHTLFSYKYVNQGFVSTTLLLKEFNGQAKENGYYIKIFVPKETHGMYITDLENVPMKEYEFLIPHHSCFIRKGLFSFELLCE